MNRLIPLVLIGVILSACAGTKNTLLSVRKENVLIEPPASIMECPPAPAPPTGEYTQRDVAAYISKLYEAHQICGTSMEKIREFIQEAKEALKSDS